MPADFTKCAREGGRVRRKTYAGGYINICYDKRGKSHSGEPHRKLKKPVRGRRYAN